MQRTVMSMKLPAILVLWGCVGANMAAADTVAINVTGTINPPGTATTPFNYTQGSYILGFAFRANSAISITQLGAYDSNLAGAAKTFANSPVGIYDLTTNTLLVSATVHASDPATGFFRYASITPVVLNTTDVYAVVGVSETNYYAIGVPASTSPVNAAIRYLSPAYFDSTGGVNGTTTNVLIQPNVFTNGNIFGNPSPPAALNNFGPNFQFTSASGLNAVGAIAQLVSGAS